MLRYTKLLGALITTLFILTGCSRFSGDNSILYNRDKEYLNAKEGTPLVIPAGIDSSTIEEHYPVVNKDYPADTKKINLLPPDLNPEEPEAKPQTTEEKINQKPDFPNYYFDRQTRNSGRYTKPVGDYIPSGSTPAQPEADNTPATSTENTSDEADTKNKHKGQNGYIMPNYYYDQHSARR